MEDGHHGPPGRPVELTAGSIGVEPVILRPLNMEENIAKGRTFPPLIVLGECAKVIINPLYTPVPYYKS